MKTKQTVVLWLIVLLVIFLLTVILFKYSSGVIGSKDLNLPKTKSNQRGDAERKLNYSEKKTNDASQEPSKQWLSAFQNRIDFWGKVVDQDGRPIKGATIDIIVKDDPKWSFKGGSNSKYTQTSNADGLFNLLGKKGAGIIVEASASGYVPMYGKETGTDLSRANVSYVGKDDNMRHTRPVRLKPAVLVLRKKKSLPNLSYIKNQNVKFNKDGAPCIVNLKTGGKGAAVDIRCWSSAPKPFNYERYDWRAEIRIKGGQLQPIIGFNQVLAPENGYADKYEIDMPSKTKRNWIRGSPRGSNIFWVKFEDETYGKFKINLSTGRRHEVDIESWYNLDSNRNFEQ